MFPEASGEGWKGLCNDGWISGPHPLKQVHLQTEGTKERVIEGGSENE